eukprot:gene16504-11801_t
MSWAREVVAWIMRKEPLQRCKILVTVEERVFWKRILPALVEKVLTDWTHRPDCECVRTSRIPLCDNGNGEKIICSCGLGQHLDEQAGGGNDTTPTRPKVLSTGDPEKPRSVDVETVKASSGTLETPMNGGKPVSFLPNVEAKTPFQTLDRFPKP